MSELELPTDLFDPVMLYECNGPDLYECRCCHVEVSARDANEHVMHKGGCPARVLLQLQYRVTLRYTEERNGPWYYKPPFLGATLEAACREAANHVPRDSASFDVFEATVGFDPNLPTSADSMVSTFVHDDHEAKERQRREAEARGHRDALIQNRQRRLDNLDHRKADFNAEGYERRRAEILNDPRYVDLPSLAERTL